MCLPGITVEINFQQEPVDEIKGVEGSIDDLRGTCMAKSAIDVLRLLVCLEYMSSTLLVSPSLSKMELMMLEASTWVDVIVLLGDSESKFSG